MKQSNMGSCAGIDYHVGKIVELVPNNENNWSIAIGDGVNDTDVVSHILPCENVYVVLAARKDNGTGRYLHAIVEKTSIHKVIYSAPWAN